MSNDLADIRERLARLETQQDAAGAVMGRIDRTVDRIDARLAAVEASSARAGAIAGGVLGIGMSLATAYLTSKVKGIS